MRLPTISPGENIRVCGELHGMTQAELGAKLGAFSRQNVSNTDNGHRPIGRAVAKRLAELFDVTLPVGTLAGIGGRLRSRKRRVRNGTARSSAV